MKRRTVTRLRVESLENRRLLDGVGFGDPGNAEVPAAVGQFDLPAEMLDDDPSGWPGYLGGSRSDRARDVAVDAAGNAWVTGWTRSPDWVAGGFDVTFDGGPYDAFVAGVGSDGQLLWSSYFGGDNEDVGFSIDVDVAGDLWLTGRTASTGWVADGFDTTFGGGQYDAMVAKITTGAALLWSAYLGGNARDGGTAGPRSPWTRPATPGSPAGPIQRAGSPAEQARSRAAAAMPSPG